MASPSPSLHGRPAARPPYLSSVKSPMRMAGCDALERLIRLGALSMRPDEDVDARPTACACDYESLGFTTRVVTKVWASGETHQACVGTTQK